LTYLDMLRKCIHRWGVDVFFLIDNAISIDIVGLFTRNDEHPIVKFVLSLCFCQIIWRKEKKEMPKNRFQFKTCV